MLDRFLVCSCMFAATVAGASECEQLGGTWTLQNHVDMSGCEEPDVDRTVNVTITQTGCDAVLDIEGEVQLDGTVDGSLITVDDSYTDEGTVYKELAFSITGDAMKGSGEWLWEAEDGSFSCHGTETFAGTKSGASAAAVCAQVAGSWTFANVVKMDACGEPDESKTLNIDIAQNGCDVSLTIDGAVSLQGRVEGDVVSINDSYEMEGTITKDLKLTASGNKLDGGGSWHWDSGDPDWSCGGTETLNGSKM